MKQEFIDFLNALMEAAPEVAEQHMTEGVKAYLSILKDNEIIDKPILTDNGKIILKYLQENQNVVTWKAKDVADGLGISSRGVSGTFRKLVTHGFVEKLGKDPAIYTLTEKGKNFVITD
jgi:predicted transcriptional regulator